MGSQCVTGYLAGSVVSGDSLGVILGGDRVYKGRLRAASRRRHGRAVPLINRNWPSLVLTRARTNGHRASGGLIRWEAASRGLIA
jgi:hypothetical protein